MKVGGKSGIDSNLVSMWASKGETIRVDRANSAREGGSMALQVLPSPYFDVRVLQLAQPVAQMEAGQARAADAHDRLKTARGLVR